MEKFEIIGKNLTPQKVEEIRTELEEIHQEALKPIEGELEKMPEERKFIEKINSYLTEEFEELGLKKGPTVLPEQVHLLPSEVFSRNSPESEFDAFHDPVKMTVYINKSKYDRVPLYIVMLHESLHLFSFHRYQYQLFFDDEKKTFVPHRTGYGVLKYQGQEESHKHFVALNEAVNDKTVQEILKKHSEELIKEFNISKEEQVGEFPYCYGYITILNLILKKIAKKNSENEEAVWQRFKKGQFSGEMMHLRDIERTFGAGALRLIAALDSGEIKNLSREEAVRKICEYLVIDDEKEKDEIAGEVLPEREYQEYLKRKN